MRTLKKDVWKNFKADGLLFEDLVRDILPLEYPGHSFQRTPHSHDGARDFEGEMPLLSGAQAKVWIECKYHQERLATGAVAMTMVMAILDQSKQIIFFSYSPVKRTFVNYVSRFQDRTGINVHVYDDQLLEDLILKHWDKLDIEKYFNIPKPRGALIDQCPVEVHMETAKEGYSKLSAINKGARSSKEFFYLNDVVEVRFFFRNIDASQKASVSLSMEPTAEKSCFLVLDREFEKKKSKDLELPCGAVRQFVLRLKLIGFQKTVRIPKFVVRVNGTTHNFPCKTIHTRWIAETPLIGRSYYDAIHETEALLAASSPLAWIKVSGRSGVGKSRLLKELCSLPTAYTARTVFIDLESRQWSFQELIQTVVSELTDLPSAVENQVFPIKENDFAESGESYAAKVLYDPSFSYSEEMEALALFVRKLLEQRAALLVIDNIQGCDALTLQYLNKLLDVGMGRLSSSAIILCFNEDQIFPGTEASALSYRLSSLAAQDPHVFLNIKVKGFTEDEALHYLNECLAWPGLEKIDVPETLRLLIKRCGTEPLYLQNMLLYLAQEHILERTETTSFFVRNPLAFHREIDKLPTTLDSLLEKREGTLLAQMSGCPGKRESYLNGIRLISAFPYLPSLLFRDVTGDPELKDDMILLGLLQEDENGGLTFRHQLVQRYFRAHYPIEKAPDSFLRMAVECVERRGLERELAQGLFLLEDVLGAVKSTVLDDVAAQVSAGHLDSAYSRHLVPALFRHIQKEPASAKELFALYNNGCFGVTHYFGLEKGLPVFEAACRYILEHGCFFSGILEEVYGILQEYEYGLLNVGRHEDAEAFLRQIESFLNKEEAETEAWRRCQTKFSIASCVVYNALGLFEEGRSAAARAVALAEGIDDLTLQIKAHMEYGYLYYYSENAADLISELTEQWGTAYALLKTKYLSDRAEESLAADTTVNAVVMTAMLGDLAAGDLNKAKEKAQKLQKMLDRTQTPFYEAKIRLALCCYELMSRLQRFAPLTDVDSILKMLHQSIDKCTAYCLTRDYPACFHLLAVFHSVCGKSCWAADNYLKAVVAAQNYIKTSAQERQWKYLFYDIAYCLRIQGAQDRKVFEKIKDPLVRKACFDILAIPDEGAEDIDVPRLSPLYLADRGINLPKV